MQTVGVSKSLTASGCPDQPPGLDSRLAAPAHQLDAFTGLETDLAFEEAFAFFSCLDLTFFLPFLVVLAMYPPFCSRLQCPLRSRWKTRFIHAAAHKYKSQETRLQADS